LSTRLAVDVGGTFSDVVVFDEANGDVRIGKHPTNPTAPEDGVIDVITASDSGDAVQRAAYFLHGTTIGINALLQRDGANVGLLTTRGFRDTLELGRGDRAFMYDVGWRPGPPLVPRELRLPITERVFVDGSVAIAVDEEDIRRACHTFAKSGVDSVAIVFINSYVNPANELAAEEALRKHGFQGHISLSHRVSGEFREYERSTTTAIDAYVRPKVSDYVRRLDRRLAEIGFAGRMLVTRSGGGSLTVDEARARPFETIQSGPVGGALAAAALCQDLTIPLGIAADVGGTSFDVSLISAGHPHVKHEGEVLGLPVQTEWVDVRSIGAGGGSVAYLDRGGRLRVGPRSAGALPGPCCYGRGGTEPTVTDAAAALGMLGDGELAGDLKLDLAAARQALSKLGRPLALSAAEVARGILEIVTAHMAGAIRAITIEQGEDPRQAALLAFGGAGPLFGCLLARELSISRVIVPVFAGNFSAWGLLAQDITRSAASTMVRALDDQATRDADEALQRLFRHLDARASNGNDRPRLRRASFALRYVGQEYTLAVPVPLNGSRLDATARLIRDMFESEYERTFGHAIVDAVELVTVRAATVEPLPAQPHPKLAPASPSRSRSPRPTYSFSERGVRDFAVVDRGELGVGTTLSGPAIVLEPTATTYVDVGFSIAVLEHGSLSLIDLETTS
jgi:N-methylhydantoinase A